ncbi:MAG: GGDEF domain-containing protein [Armatimonadota bacterium]|nr:GGDEF domain-containing protein [Armatimonadota bacterium]MDR7450266.1 GGDEF domain-containing protein [Armatimonadota bacterium]MDR7467151.1 GGDEF domain-containing protein [Armatimonadota bacterium]MDR7493307.1 GGDEF domain-containing protein [Armatimonadota bacterium]MDR7500156.1 GGDEF domain-containing protein [Armatimonadota bacterium]
MRTTDKRAIKERRVLLAGGGLILALLVELALEAVGFNSTTLRGWLIALGATVVLQCAVWLILRLGWDRAIAWDPHYLYVPMAAAIFSLNLYAYLAPPLRPLLLMVWFAMPAFMVGLAGAAGVLVMSTLMAAGYVASGVLLAARGYDLSPAFEAGVVVIFLITNGFTSVVYERLRRERIERRVLRQKLSELAITDPLTGLFNRRHFEEILRAEIARIARYGGHCSLAMIDLDFFKHYNDTLGHLAGDALLKELSALLAGHLRVSDVFARYGGEEFGLIMVNTAKDEAILAMERLRLLVERYPFRGGDIQPSGRLTISAGIASCPEDGLDYEELVRKADAALYAAKRLGRNRVEAALPV